MHIRNCNIRASSPQFFMPENWKQRILRWLNYVKREDRLSCCTVYYLPHSSNSPILKNCRISNITTITVITGRIIWTLQVIIIDILVVILTNVRPLRRFAKIREIVRTLRGRGPLKTVETKRTCRRARRLFTEILKVVRRLGRREKLHQRLKTVRLGRIIRRRRPTCRRRRARIVLTVIRLIVLIIILIIVLIVWWLCGIFIVIIIYILLVIVEPKVVYKQCNKSD